VAAIGAVAVARLRGRAEPEPSSCDRCSIVDEGQVGGDREPEDRRRARACHRGGGAAPTASSRSAALERVWGEHRDATRHAMHRSRRTPAPATQRGARAHGQYPAE
jgi:hypothetical protein